MIKSRWIFNPNDTFCANCMVRARSPDNVTPYCPYCGSYMINYDNKPCSAYHIEYGKAVCWGTKEREECNCNGDKRKCNFYEY